MSFKDLIENYKEDECRYVCLDCNDTYLHKLEKNIKGCPKCGGICMPVTYELYELWLSKVLKKEKKPVVHFCGDYYPEYENGK